MSTEIVFGAEEGKERDINLLDAASRIPPRVPSAGKKAKSSANSRPSDWITVAL
jgi:hypothetical protein